MNVPGELDVKDKEFGESERDASAGLNAAEGEQSC